MDARSQYTSALHLSLIATCIGGGLGIILISIIALIPGQAVPLPRMLTLLLLFAVSGFMQGVVWRIFEKAGYHGAASLIPVYNVLVLHEIAGLPLWLILVWLIPGFNGFAILLLYYGIAKNFGQGTIFALGLILFGFVLFPLLAFGKYEHTGEWRLTL